MHGAEEHPVRKVLQRGFQASVVLAADELHDHVPGRATKPRKVLQQPYEIAAPVRLEREDILDALAARATKQAMQALHETDYSHLRLASSEHDPLVADAFAQWRSFDLFPPPGLLVRGAQGDD